MKIFNQSIFDRWPLEDKSVQAIITSPPYWNLRKYEIPDVMIGNWKGQYGLEPSFQLYIEHTLFWCKEAWRVLKDDGVFFLNIGDSYSIVSGNMRADGAVRQSKITNKDSVSFNQAKTNLPDKCKLLIPHRVAVALIDEGGWVVRNDIVWYKSNAMPESTSDRFSKKFEMVFMFVKQGKYQFDLDAVKILSKTIEYDKRAGGFERTRTKKYTTKIDKANSELYGSPRARRHRENYQEKPANSFVNPGDVWSIPTSPSPEAHYAMWPEKLVERMLLCSTKVGDVILDPFAGSCTTLRVADKNNRIAYGIELGYQEIQKRRMTNIQKKLIF